MLVSACYSWHLLPYHPDGFRRSRWKKLASEKDGFVKITVPVLKKFIQEEKTRVKEDKATAKKLVTKGGKPELIQLIRSYFGIKI